MTLEIIIIWISLGALALFFGYCCARISDGPDKNRVEEDFPLDPLASANTGRGS